MTESVLFRLPSMGEGVREARVVKWLKHLHEYVHKDEPLIEVSTDKVDTEIISPADGFLLAQFVQVGESISVHQSLAQIAPSLEAVLLTPEDGPTLLHKKDLSQSKDRFNSSLHKDRDSSLARKASFLEQSHASLGGTYAGRPRSSPLVRKLALEHGVRLQELSGSGLHGRITEADLWQHLDLHTSEVSQASSDLPLLLDPIFRVQTKMEGGKELLDGVEVSREPMSPVRRLTAEHMIRSVRTSPHVSTTFEMNLSSMISFKKDHEKAFLEKNKFKLTYTPLFIWAAAQTLAEFPQVNSSVDGDFILYKKSINIGCAVASASGLIVPVLHETQGKSWEELACALHDKVLRTHKKQLQAADLQGGTFTITNPGMYGSLHSQPIINQPQVAILSVGAIVERALIRNEKVVMVPLAQIGLTFDHRVVDGELGAKFLASFEKNLKQL